MSKFNEFSNSAEECGKLVNNILKRVVSPNLKTHPLIAKYKGSIVKSCRLNFDYLFKMLIMLKSLNIMDFQPQNYEVSSILIRMMMIETLLLMCKATSGDKTCLVNEINATLWHVLVLYYFSNRFFIVYYDYIFINY